jgi:uncharacterized protein YdaU (DUF1376 family)
MYYFKFNIGDYASHTRHLSPIEDIAYRRLLDLAYTSENPITDDIRELSRLINMRDYQQEIIDILNEYWEHVTEGWINNRVLKELEATGVKSESASRSAKMRWDKAKEANAMRLESERIANASKSNANASKIDATHNTLPITQDQLNSNALSPPAEKPLKADPIQYEEIVNLYHQTLPMCPKVVMLTSKRKGQIAARWKSGNLPDLQTWSEYFKFVSESPFLTGKTDPINGHKRFVADLEWITTESNFTKIAERKYHGKV